MTKKITAKERDWYFNAIDKIGENAVKADRPKDTVTYHASISSDESHVKSADPEELAHAVLIGLLAGKSYKYPLSAIGHEIHFAHGSKGSKSDEVDVLIRDPDGLPYAVIELKASNEFDSERVDAIKNQLFGTAPLVGAPKLLIYATVDPKGASPKPRAICIDYTKYKSFESWQSEGEPHSQVIPADYQDIGYEPYVIRGRTTSILIAHKPIFEPSRCRSTTSFLANILTIRCSSI